MINHAHIFKTSIIINNMQIIVIINLNVNEIFISVKLIE